MLKVTSAASVTVTVSVDVTPEDETVISALPFFTPTTVPPSTVATAGSLLVQLALLVASEVVPSLLTSVAFTSADVPAASDSSGGVSSKETAVAAGAPAAPPGSAGRSGTKSWSSQPTPVMRNSTNSPRMRSHVMLTYSLSRNQFEIQTTLITQDIMRRIRITDIDISYLQLQHAGVAIRHRANETLLQN